MEATTSTAIPVVNGDSYPGNTLTSSIGSWSGTSPFTYTYQWKRNGSLISGGTSSSYLLTNGDVGYSVTCEVTATNSAGSASATSSGKSITNSAPVNYYPKEYSPGTVFVGETATCSTGSCYGNQPITYVRKWFDENIQLTPDGVDSPTYIVTNNELFQYLICYVTASNSVGSVTDSDNRGAAVSRANNGSPFIQFPPMFTLTLFTGYVTTGTWYNSPTSYTYQWAYATINPNGTWTFTDIPGYTNPNGANLLPYGGKYVYCKVTAHNAVGSTTVHTSAILA
jgi:hypothetical protein